MNRAIEIIGLTKNFPKHKTYLDALIHPFQKDCVTALDGINLQVNCGELLCLLGSNGAGKTTLIKILSSLVLPTQGKVFVNGYDVTKEGKQARRCIGLVVSEERSFYWRLTGRQNLEFFASLYKLPHRQANKRVDELIELIDLERDADRMFKDYSSGIRQRLAIARGLIHDPDILLMDEPSRSLDPLAARGLRRFILDRILGKKNKTILLATHNLEEVETFNRRAAIIHQGRIKVIGSLDEVKAQARTDSIYTIRIEGPSEQFISQVKQSSFFEDMKIVSAPHNALRVEVDVRVPESRIPGIIENMILWGGRISACYAKPTPLTEVFSTFIQSDKC